jgi:hypothetical protein
LAIATTCYFASPPYSGRLLPRFQTGRSPFPLVDITTASTGQFPRMRLSLTRSATERRCTARLGLPWCDRSSPLTDPTVRDYRSGFLRSDSLLWPKSVLPLPVQLFDEDSLDILSRVLCLVYVAPRRYVSLFPPSLQWVPWPLLSEALWFPTFVGTMGSYDCCRPFPAASGLPWQQVLHVEGLFASRGTPSFPSGPGSLWVGLSRTLLVRDRQLSWVHGKSF